jgi:glutamate-ammonia-ligase adenylyltransferase
MGQERSQGRSRLINSFPDKSYAEITIQRFKEVNGHIGSSEEELLFLLSSYSHFLGRAVIRYPSILRSLMESDFVERQKPLEAFIEDAIGMQEDQKRRDQFISDIRKYKYSELSRIIYRDIKALGEVTEIMEELSDLAGAILEAVFRFYNADLHSTADGEFVIVAMGKLGGRELNLSSDIDLIYLYQDSGDPEPFFKLAERLTKAVSSVTEHGFLYRVDLGLRPGGGKSTIAVSLEGALEHYFYWGDTWERAALIKARPVAGNISLGDKFVKQVEPFVYKKFLDYASIEDLKDMKTKVEGLNVKRDVKLGRGGIRNVEFFVQALQLVNGGKIKAIREKNTVKALQMLSKTKLIPRKQSEDLIASYVFLRRVEHALQLVDELQTHRLPAESSRLRVISSILGFDCVEDFQMAYAYRTSKVSKIFDQLFYEPSKKVEEEGREFWELADFLTEGNITQEQALESLRGLGFKDPEGSIEIINVLLDPKKGGLTQRGRALARRVIPAFLKNILHSADPDSALRNIERFISCIGGRTSIYAILAENPEILQLLSRLFSTSGFLSNFLIRHPEYLDVITLKDSRSEYETREEMIEELGNLVREEDLYEGKLNAIRRFKNAETLKLCLRDLNDEVDSLYVGRYLTRIAEASLEIAIRLAYEVVGPKSRRRRMDVNSSDMVIIGMGKLGGMEMSYNSDLDINFIYDGDDQEYFSRLGQKIISILSIPTGEGFAYKIDMGLRPSGRAGALVSSFESFKRYHEESAKLWERQALIKARLSAGNMQLGSKVMNIINYFVYEKSLAEDFHKEIYHLRERIEKEIAKESETKLNLKTGRGGLVDIEFLVQMLQLRFGGSHLEVRRQNTMEVLNSLKSCKLINERFYHVLNDGYCFLKRLENLLRLLHDRSISEVYDSDFQKLAAEMELTEDGDELRKTYIHKTEDIRSIYDEYFL